MKYILQLCIILFISFIGELLRALIHIPVPASIYGLLLMLLCLVTKIIKLEWVKDTGTFLIEVMPLMFVPAVVGLIAQWSDVSKLLLPIIIVIPVTTVIVFVVSGRITQSVLRRGKREDK
jgi:holin-like protein